MISFADGQKKIEKKKKKKERKRRKERKKGWGKGRREGRKTIKNLLQILNPKGEQFSTYKGSWKATWTTGQNFRTGQPI